MGEREDYTGEREYDTENGSSRTGHRKRKNKPLLEKRRRARINESLVQLKSLVLESVQHDAAQYSKLEKADILEMTVSHLMQLQKQHVSACAHMVGMLSKFRVGYNECTHEVVRYLSEDMDGVAPEVRTRLLNHLVSCIETTNVTRVAGHDKIAVMNNIQVDTNNYPYQKRNHNQIRTSLEEKRGLMNNEGCTKLNIPVTPRKASQNRDLQLKTNYSENEIKIPKTEFPSLQFIQLSDESNRLQIHPQQKPSKLNAVEVTCLSAQTKVNQRDHPHHQMQMNPNTFTAHDGSYDSLLMAMPNGTNADKITTWDSIVPSMDFSLRERTCVTQFNGRERYMQCSPPSFDRRDKNNNHAYNPRASTAFKPNNRTYTNVNLTGSRLEEWPCVNSSPEKLNFHINSDFPKPETRHQDVVSAATIEEMAPNMFANASNNVWRPW